MGKVNSCIETMIKKYIFRNQDIKWDILQAIIDILYGREAHMMRHGICPFCGRQYKHLISHYLRGECCRQYKQMVEDIIQWYHHVRAIVKTTGKHGKAVHMVLVSSPYPKFRTRYEAAVYAIRYLLEKQYHKTFF